MKESEKKKILKDNVYKREELIYVFSSLLVKKLFERNKYGRSNNKIFRYCNY